MAQSSENLVKEILKGNEAAMELLVRKNYDMVQNFIYRFVGDYNLSYDLTQEVFIKMMKSLHKYRFMEGSFESWLLKIASNHCKDYFKSSGYRQRSHSSDIEEAGLTDSESVIEIFERNERRKAVKSAVNDLPVMQREAIILKYYHGMKIKEISKITGDNENTIKSRLFSGINNLRKKIGGEVYEKGCSSAHRR